MIISSVRITKKKQTNKQNKQTNVCPTDNNTAIFGCLSYGCLWFTAA